VSPAGTFGPLTSAAVTEFRATHGLGSAPQVDQATWRALLAAFVTAPPPRSDGSGSPSSGSGSSGSGSSGSPSSGSGSGSPGSGSGSPGSGGAAAPGSAEHPELRRYAGTVLRPGMRGAAVAAVQRVLRVSPVSGRFGALTRAAVVRFQRAHGIRPTGNVGPLTWQALIT
jgi:peptidoglycan hydrolase-like protein with peptidoglycan-binding domain